MKHLVIQILSKECGDFGPPLRRCDLGDGRSRKALVGRYEQNVTQR